MPEAITVYTNGEFAPGQRQELENYLAKQGLSFTVSNSETEQQPQTTINLHELQVFEAESERPKGVAVTAWGSLANAYCDNKLQGLIYNQDPLAQTKCTRVQRSLSLADLDLISLDTTFTRAEKAAKNSPRYGVRSNFGLNFGTRNIDFLRGYLDSEAVRRQIYTPQPNA